VEAGHIGPGQPAADRTRQGPPDASEHPAWIPVRQLLVHDTWTDRDLPVLDATVTLLEQSFMVTVTDIAERTGLEPSVVAAALETLDPVYLDFRKTTTGGDPRFWYVYKATPEARRMVGQWPTAEALASRLADELASAAAREQDAEQQSLLIYAARLIGDTLRDATVRAARHVLAPAFGGVPVPEVGGPVSSPAREPENDQPSLAELPEPAPAPRGPDSAVAAAEPLTPVPDQDLPAPAVPAPAAESAGRRPDPESDEDAAR
jgi:predicted transcriptional regulator